MIQVTPPIDLKEPPCPARVGGRARFATFISDSPLRRVFKVLPTAAVHAVLMGVFVSVAPAETVKLESLATIDGRIYQKVEVIGHDAVGIKIKHEGGIARLPFEKLPKDIRSRYGYDPAKAAALRTEEDRRARELQQQIDDDARRQKQAQPRHQADPGDETDSNPATAADLDLESPPGDAEIAKLEIYVIRMKSKIATARLEAGNLEKQASMESLKMKSVRTVSPDGMISESLRPDTRAQFRAKSLRRRADELRRKIEHANALVSAAEAKIARVSGNPPSE